MRRGKRAAALVVAIGMAVSGTMAVYAADAPATTGSTTITGTIKITSIQVVVPISAAFDIDPNVKVTEGAAVVTSNDESNTNQIITQASDYAIENTSKVPLVVSVTGIATKNKTGGTEGAPTLVNTMGGLTGKNVMFAVRKAGESINYPGASSDTTGVWMTTETVKEGSPYNMAKNADDNIIAAGAKFTMTLFGATGNGWSNGDSFQVIPTFTIALK
ncbi:MAG: hypothetical protein KH024_13470 [Hungatella hathewayi]|nr:hypothetical protein [Hungatella hathewayi]